MNLLMHALSHLLEGIFWMVLSGFLLWCAITGREIELKVSKKSMEGSHNGIADDC